MDNNGGKVCEDTVEIKEETWDGSLNLIKQPEDLEESIIKLQEIKVKQELLKDEEFIETFVGAHASSSLMVTVDNVKKEFKKQDEFINYECDLGTLKEESEPAEAGFSDQFKIDAQRDLKEKYFCPLCQKFSTGDHRNESKEKFYKCKFCLKYSRKANLPVHSRIHTGENPYECKIYLKQLSLKHIVTSHSTSHAGETPYKRTICLKQFSQNSDLTAHSRIHTGENPNEKPGSCGICLRPFPLRMLTRHKIHSRKELYTCKSCLKQIPKKAIEKLPYECTICLKQFTAKQTLVCHSRIHTGEKPYQCEICFKQFCIKTNLTTHSRIHTGEKPYKCETCLAQFSSQSGLNYHYRIHTGETPYKCEICLKQFSSKQSSDRHSRIHTGESPYKCEICLKHLSSKSNLTVHSRIHTGENKPYKCKICLTAFSKKPYLTKHSIIHTGECPKKEKFV